jgi:hypothetical protein
VSVFVPEKPFIQIKSGIHDCLIIKRISNSYKKYSVVQLLTIIKTWNIEVRQHVAYIEISGNERDKTDKQDGEFCLTSS